MPNAATPSGGNIYPHVSPEYVNIVSQTLPGLPSLGLDVSALLAQDAEYYIRHVIHLAKKRMRHSKRTSLSVEDVYFSDNRKDLQPSLGHLSPVTPSFQQIPSFPGLYVLHDTAVSLFDVLREPLPLTSKLPEIQRSGIISPSSSFETEISPANATNPLIIAIDTYLSAPLRISPNIVQRTLTTICSPRTDVPFYMILAILRHVVNANATRTGNSAVLHAALRIASALAARPTFGVELFEDSLLAIVLTCLIGPNLGCRGHDMFELRQQAAETLHICLTHAVDDFVRQKVCNTLSAALTDSNATLDVVFGAIIGLASMGRHIFEPIVIPLIPKLILALDKLSKIATSLDLSAAHDTLSQITYLSQAVERSMHVCGLTCPEPDFVFSV